MGKIVLGIISFILVVSLIAYSFGLHFDTRTVINAISTSPDLEPLNINDFTLIPNNLFDGQDWGVFTPVKNVLQVGADGINTFCYVGANLWRTVKLFVHIVQTIVLNGDPATAPDDGTDPDDNGGWRGGR